ncbi:MAG: conjugal transfer protein TraB [Pseudomonadota bacterium]
MAGQDKNLQSSDDLRKVSDETILKIAKEIAVKFIEVGRVTPTTFPSAFTSIYATIEKTVRGSKL